VREEVHYPDCRLIAFSVFEQIGNASQMGDDTPVVTIKDDLKSVIGHKRAGLELPFVDLVHTGAFLCPPHLPVQFHYLFEVLLRDLGGEGQFFL